MRQTVVLYGRPWVFGIKPIIAGIDALWYMFITTKALQWLILLPLALHEGHVCWWR